MIHRKNTNKQRENVLEGVELYEGQSLMEQLRKMKENGEKPEIVHEMIYTEKKRGVIAAYNIRADRFEIGQENAERISKYKNSKEMQSGVLTDEAENTESVEVKKDASTKNH